MPMATASMSRPDMPPYVCSPSKATSRLRAASATSPSFTARNPPMLANGSFLALMVRPSLAAQRSLDDLANAPPLLARLALLDEPGVFGDARGVEDDFHRVVPRQFLDRFHVGERNGLAAGHVHGCRHADVWNAAGILLEYALQLAKIHISLEWALGGWIVRLVDDDVHEASSGHLLVETRSREVHVARDDVALPDQDA